MIDRVIRLLLAMLIAATLYVQLGGTVHGGRSIPDFFSFFTTESNMIVILALVWANPILRGAATVYITITGLVFNGLLGGIQETLHLTVGWIDVVLHDVSPLSLIAWWAIAPPRLPLGYAKLISLWMLYPCAYLAYTLVRGAQTSWYPYGFLDPLREGWGIVTLFCTCALVALIALSWLAISRAAAKRTDLAS